MTEFVWLLLPVAAASGWFAAHQVLRKKYTHKIPLTDEYLKGFGYLLNEQSERALEVFLGIVAADAETVEAHLILGSLFRRRGEVDRAIRVHQSLLLQASLDTKLRARAILELGRDYMKAGVLDRAETLFKEVNMLGYLQAESYARLCTLYEQEKEWDKAIWAATNLALHSPTPQHVRIAHYFCELAQLSLQHQAIEQASLQAQQALNKDPASLRACLILGHIALHQKQWHDAITYLSKAMAQDTRLATLVLDAMHEAHLHLDSLAEYRHFLLQELDQQEVPCARLALLQALDKLKEDQVLERLLTEEMQREQMALAVLLTFLRLCKRKGHLSKQDPSVSMIDALERYLKRRALFRCQHCGFKANSHFWCCPSCHTWGTLFCFH